MKIKEKIQEYHRFLTTPTVVKLSLKAAIITWIGCTVVAVLIAQLDPAGPGPDPAGYNLLINYISDLGNEDLTPMPIIINWGMMNTSLLMLSPVLYLMNLLGKVTKARRILAYLTGTVLLVAMGGFFLNGILSEDVGEAWDALFPIGIEWHEVTTAVTFGFFMVGGIMTASQVIIFPDILKEKFMLDDLRIRKVRIFNIINSWISTPACFIFFNSVPYLWYTDAFWTYLPAWQWAPMWEWLLMINLSVWLMSTSGLLLEHLKNEMSTCN